MILPAFAIKECLEICINKAIYLSSFLFVSKSLHNQWEICCYFLVNVFIPRNLGKEQDIIQFLQKS